MQSKIFLAKNSNVTYMIPMRTFITDPNEYPTIEHVPPQLQHNIAFAHSTGVPVDCLAIIYDMPENWIQLFIVLTGTKI